MGTETVTCIRTHGYPWPIPVVGTQYPCFSLVMTAMTTTTLPPPTLADHRLSTSPLHQPPVHHISHACNDSNGNECHDSVLHLHPLTLTTTMCMLDINNCYGVFTDYISARAHYSRVRSTLVPSVACQTTEGEYLLLTTFFYLLIPCSYPTGIY